MVTDTSVKTDTATASSFYQVQQLEDDFDPKEAPPEAQSLAIKDASATSPIQPPALDASLTRFLGCKTPKQWLQQASEQLPTIIIDHANCEKKAAATALKLLNRYIDRPQLLNKLSQLAREELLHFEQVVALMRERGIEYRRISAAHYAQALLAPIRKSEPGYLIDQLIVGAFIEARSCERFHSLIPYVDQTLARYYQYLLRSESRHFLEYLELASTYSQEAGETKEAFDARVEFFRTLEAELIQTPCDQLRFHSGPVLT